MISLEKNLYRLAFELYQANQFFFPLIGAVLLNKQDGRVYVDNSQSPSQVYVEHVFGFAQLFGTAVSSFEKQLEDHLIVSRCFQPNKVRLYSPSDPGFIESLKQGSALSYRQRFSLNIEKFERHWGQSSESNDVGMDIAWCDVQQNNILLVDQKFGLTDRFWRTPDDFIANSKAVLIKYRGEPASICYAAAVADGSAEIDILTLEKHRKKGLAKYAVMRFIRNCLNTSMVPLWDCFANNAGSMALAESVGFDPLGPTYNFFTIDKEVHAKTG